MKKPYFRGNDVVIALSNPKNLRSQQRTKGDPYVVHDTMSCIECGEQKINLGTYHSQEGSVQCGCGLVSTNFGKPWTASKHFCKRKNLYNLLLESIDEEEFELSGIVREIIENETLKRILTLTPSKEFYKNKEDEESK